MSTIEMAKDIIAELEDFINFTEEDEIEPDYAERVQFINCDAEECEELCNEYNIVNVPTVIMFKNGEKVDGFLGNLSRDKIIEKIEKHV